MSFKHERKKVFGLLREFLSEVRHHLPKLYAFTLVILVLWGIFQVLYLWNGFNLFLWVVNHPYLDAVSHFISSMMVSGNYLGVYFIYSIAAIFIFPAPLEVLYLTFLSHDFPFPYLYIATILGILTAQQINFFLGRYFGKHIHPHLKKSTVRKFRRWVDKYGAYTIFIINMTPLPYALLNFVVGMSSFSYRRWLLLAVPAIMLNYLIQYLFFVLVLS